MSLTWRRPEEVALQLFLKYPDIRPAEVALPDLPKWVAELPDFQDTPAPEDPRALEVIHRHWCDEWREVNG